MPPPKEACQLYKDAMVLKKETVATYKKVRSTLKAIIKALYNLSCGIVDTLGAEILAAVASIASSAATALAAAASAAVASAVEAIFAALLKVFLAIPNVVFALVLIPQKRALNLLREEAIKIGAAGRNLDAILNIIAKWTSMVAPSPYYKQMTQAMPLIKKSIELLSSIIEEINPDNVEIFFDQSKYDLVQNKIKEAVRITKPYSTISIVNNFTAEITAETERLYNERAVAIEAKYKADRSYLTNSYQVRIANSNNDVKYKDTSAATLPVFNPSGTGAGIGKKLDNFQTEAHTFASDLQNTVTAPEFWKAIDNKATNVKRGIVAGLNEQALWQNYDYDLAILDAKKKGNLLEARGKAINDARKNFDVRNRINQMQTEVVAMFTMDINFLMNNLEEFSRNMASAYSKYKQSQLTCNTVYNIKAIVTNILNFMIAIIRVASNGTSTATTGILKTSRVMLQATEDVFAAAIEKNNSTDGEVSKTEMCIKLIAGHSMLIGADSVMAATITQSLIDLLNAPANLSKSNNEFDGFIQRMSNIPDWDGKVGVWCVEPLQGTISPYIEVIADAAALVIKIPSAALTGSAKSKANIQRLFRKCRSNITNLVRHNSAVQQTLQSYRPFQYKEVADLEKILSKLGLLDQFGTAMDIASALTTLLKMDYNLDNLGDLVPTYKNCVNAYPEMFNDPMLAAEEAKAKTNKVPEHAYPEKMEKLDGNAADCQAMKTAVAQQQNAQ